MRVVLYANIKPRRGYWGDVYGPERVKLTRNKPKVELPDSRTFKIELDIDNAEFQPVPMVAEVVR